MPSFSDQLNANGLKWVDDPILQMQCGRPFVPRAGVYRKADCIAVICTFPNYAMERGLTTDITYAQNIVSAQNLIHLRPHAKSSFVGTRNLGEEPVYEFGPEVVSIDGVALSISDLCSSLPTDNRDGWNDCPLGGLDLPRFGDLESFLNWWDFHPGKQKFEIIDGQVHLAQGFLSRPQGPHGFRGDLRFAARQLGPDHLKTYSGHLVQTGPVSAICPDLVFCNPPQPDSPFVEAKACVLFIRHGWTEDDIQMRVHLLRNTGSAVAVLDTKNMKFTGQFETETERFVFCGRDLKLTDLIAEALR